MKAAVHLQGTLELIAVVDVSQDFVDIGERRGIVELVVAPPLDFNTMSDTSIIAAPYEKITASVKVLRSGTAVTIAIFVQSRDHLAKLRKARGLRQLWPRKRAKRDNDYRRVGNRRTRLPYPLRA